MEVITLYSPLLSSLVPSQALPPPVHPDEVSVTHLLVAGGDNPGKLNLGDDTAAVREGSLLTGVVAPGEDGLATQVVLGGTAGVTWE